jgi:hypothetical protein
MADFTPVSQQLNTGDVFGTLNNVLGLQQKKQALQIQGQELQQKQIETTNLQNYQNFFNDFDPSAHQGSNHMLSIDSVHQMSAYQNAGAAKPLIDQQLNAITNGQIKNNTDLYNLGANKVGFLTQRLGTLARDADVQAGNDDGYTKVKAELEMLGTPDQLGDTAGPWLKNAENGLSALQGNEKLKATLGRHLQNMQYQGVDTLNQINLQNPPTTKIMGPDNRSHFVESSTTALPGQPGTQVGTEVQEGIPPERRIVTDRDNRQFVLEVGTGKLTPLADYQRDQQQPPAQQPPAGAAPSGAGAAPPAPAAKPPTRIAPPKGIQFQQPVPQQKEVNDTISAAHAADQDYNLNKHINNQLLDLSKDTATGPGTEAWHRALGTVAGPFGGNAVSDYQTIDAMLDRQIALQRGSMNLPETNAGLATAAGATGKTSYEPKALQTKVKLSQALNEGAHDFRSGLDKLTGTGTNQDQSRVIEFKNAWARNFDPRVYLYRNAKDRGKNDPDSAKEASDAVSKMSPEQAKDLVQKRQNLKLLSQGIIPTQ